MTSITYHFTSQKLDRATAVVELFADGSGTVRISSTKKSTCPLAFQFAQPELAARLPQGSDICIAAARLAIGQAQRYSFNAPREHSQPQPLDLAAHPWIGDLDGEAPDGAPDGYNERIARMSTPRVRYARNRLA